MSPTEYQEMATLKAKDDKSLDDWQRLIELQSLDCVVQTEKCIALYKSHSQRV